MQETGTLLSIDEYLDTSFEGPDREFVDGIIVERNLGELDHGNTQGELICFFRSRRSKLNTWAFPEVRVQVSATRFRVPDVSVCLGPPTGARILRAPPFLVIEILSADDRASDMQERIDDYLAFGVPYIWVIDPRTRRDYMYTPEGARPAADGILGTDSPAIELPLEQLWTI